MYTPATFTAALILTVLCTCCWGSWANTFKLTRGYRFELFYWDYAVGVFLVSLLFAFTLGSRGGEAGFLANLRLASPGALWSAAAGGFIFNIANVLLVAAIDMVGLAIAFPLAIGIALVEGTLLSYAIHPAGNPVLLFAGVACALLAVVLIGFAYAARGVAGEVATRKGILICLVAGVLMGSWAPLLGRSLAAPTGALTPYTAAVLMTFGAFVCCFVFNPFLMRRPLVGTPVKASDYVRGPIHYHLLGLLGGAVWGTGTVLNLVASAKVGLPISYAIGQSAPLIATLWGVLVWKEFRGAPTRSKVLLGCVVATYLLALALISSSYQAA
ncbi:glucose uptake protein [Bryocella elongata]|uniref:Glucose uptake protein n=1 Tax=Bryocella elongata TaxID=863522 RepID=A0A1H5U567_9BACT|nr:GRP family sugar transporter [Bryocella elongata]SEF70150.1 glucose uptake protein [Bryocella elongata]